MRQGTAGGWAVVSIAKIIALSILNSMGIKKLNHTHVIQFNNSPYAKIAAFGLSQSPGVEATPGPLYFLILGSWYRFNRGSFRFSPNATLFA
jgi:hypothetical protein